MVVISHARDITLIEYDRVEQKALWVKGLYSITGLGREAVVIFFVISGFLVGGVTLERWRARGVDLRAYAVARVSRIYVVLVPALLMGILLDSIGMHWFNASELYTNSAQYMTTSLQYQISAGMDLRTFASNLFMLEGIYTEHLGSNAPLWSLAYEWWYYCLFALIGAALTGSGKKRLWFAIAAVVVAAWLPTSVTFPGLVWLLGIGGYAWSTSRLWRPPLAVGLGAFFAALVVSRVSHNMFHLSSHLLTDVLLGVAFVFVLAGADRVRVPLPRLQQALADFSYTTYLFHFPAIVFTFAIGYQVFGLRFHMQPGARGLLVFFGSVAVVYAYCLGASLLAERNTAKVRKTLDSWTRRIAGSREREALGVASLDKTS